MEAITSSTVSCGCNLRMYDDVRGIRTRYFDGIINQLPQMLCFLARSFELLSSGFQRLIGIPKETASWGFNQNVKGVLNS
jgi:hypothetical protein